MGFENIICGCGFAARLAEGEQCVCQICGSSIRNVPPGGRCCYARRKDEPTCCSGHDPAETKHHHRDDTSATMLTCEEVEAKFDRICQERGEQFARIAEAVGCFGADWIPVYKEGTEQIISAIDTLREKARKYDVMIKQNEEFNRLLPTPGEPAKRKVTLAADQPAGVTRHSESGPGLRAQGGKFTEPGNVKIYCDNGEE